MVGGRCKMINIMEGVRALQLRGHLVYRGGVEGGAVCQASQAQEGIEPCWKELGAGKSWWEPACAGPTTCMGRAAEAAYSSGWSLGRLQHPLLLVKHQQAVFKSTAAALVMLLKLQF